MQICHLQLCMVSSICSQCVLSSKRTWHSKCHSAVNLFTTRRIFDKYFISSEIQLILFQPTCDSLLELRSANLFFFFLLQISAVIFVHPFFSSNGLIPKPEIILYIYPNLSCVLDNLLVQVHSSDRSFFHFNLNALMFVQD